MNKDPSANGGNEKKKHPVRRRWVVFGIIYLVAVLAIALIVNSKHLNDFLNYNLMAVRPVIIGLLIAYIVNPLYNFLHDNIFTWDKKAQVVRKTLSMVCTYAVIVLFIIVVVLLLLPQLSASIQDLSNNIETYLNETFAYLNELIGKLNLPIEVPTLSVEYILEKLPGGDHVSGQQKWQNLIANIGSVASTYVVQIVGLVFDLLIALFIAGYTLASKQRISAQIRRILTAFFKEKGCREIVTFVSETDKTFGRYIVGKLVDSMLVVVVASAVFSLAKLPYAILIGVIIGVANIIPFFGPILGAIPCGLLVFIAEPRKLITFIILVLVVQQIDANITDPLITGNATGLSSLGVIVAVTVMGNYFGILGMFIGVPLTVSLLSLGKKLLDRRLTADDMPTELEPYYPPKTEKIDMGSGEHVPFFTKLVHSYQARKQLIQARAEAKRTKKSGGDVNRILTEEDVGTECDRPATPPVNHEENIPAQSDNTDESNENDVGSTDQKIEH